MKMNLISNTLEKIIRYLKFFKYFEILGTILPLFRVAVMYDMPMGLLSPERNIRDIFNKKIYRQTYLERRHEIQEITNKQKKKTW
jgi:hypothetical protein